MEKIILAVDKYQSRELAAPIRSRFDALSTWMHAIKIIINYYPPGDINTAGHLGILKAKMSRIFFSNDNKTFSMAFPFNVESKDGGHLVKTLSGIEIDSRLSSEILLTAEKLKERRFSSERDLVAHFDGEPAGRDFWPAFSEVLDAEDGYLRFDHDPDQEKGHKHPLNHADLFYTNGASFKLGLHHKVTLNEIIDILDRDTDCHYLSAVKNVK